MTDSPVTEAALAPKETGATEELTGEIVAPAPAQPARIIIALTAFALGVAAYAYVLLNFWKSSWLGIHLRVPYPAFLLILAGLLLALAALRIGLGIRSPHLKLAMFVLSFLAALIIAIGGARFFVYAMYGTRIPPYELKIATGQHFPEFALPNQKGALFRKQNGVKWLIAVYRGDSCPFARYELRQVVGRVREFAATNTAIIAISADPVDHSKKLATYLRTRVPLLSDTSHSLLEPLGLLQHHKNQPDNAIPAFFLLDKDGVVRWIFASPYYREQPSPELLLKQAAAIP